MAYVRHISWTDFKSLIASHSLNIQYDEDSVYYHLFALEWNVLVHRCDIEKGTADATDFEDNYKDSANSALIQPIHILGVGGYFAEVDVNGAISISGDVQTIVNPLQYNTVRMLDRTIPKKKLYLAAMSNAPFLVLQIPTGKKWILTGWNGSGQNKGYYVLEDIDMSEADVTNLETFEAIGGWSAVSGFSNLQLTTDSEEGTYAFKVDFDTTTKKTGYIQKTFSPAVDWSGYSKLRLGCKKTPSNAMLEVYIRLYEGGKNYEFIGQSIGDDYCCFCFDMNDADNIDTTAIDKIEIWAEEVYDQDISSNVYFDALKGISGEIITIIDQFYSNEYHPFSQPFYTAVVVEAGHFVRAKVYNEENSSANFEVGINGREVDA